MLSLVLGIGNYEIVYCHLIWKRPCYISLKIKAKSSMQHHVQSFISSPQLMHMVITGIAKIESWYTFYHIDGHLQHIKLLIGLILGAIAQKMGYIHLFFKSLCCNGKLVKSLLLSWKYCILYTKQVFNIIPTDVKKFVPESGVLESSAKPSLGCRTTISCHRCCCTYTPFAPDMMFLQSLIWRIGSI